MPPSHQGRDGNDAAVAGGESLLPCPHLAEEHVVIELGEFGGKAPSSSRPAVIFCSIKTSY